MAIPAGELSLQKSMTQWFIDANPMEIILIPRTRQSDGRGSRLVDGPPRAPQVFRLIDQSTARNTIPGKVQTSDGVERLVDFILLGMPGVSVELFDYWVDGETYEVTEIYPDNQYEVRAAVVRRA